MEIKLQSPATGHIETGWKVWDRIVEYASLVLAAPCVPVAGAGRSVARMGQRSKLAEFRDEYEKTHYQLQLTSRTSVDFLATYLKRLHELRQRFLTTEWSSLEEAQNGYQLLLAAEAMLLAEAQHTSQQLTVHS